MISVFFFADVSYQRVGLVRARSCVVVVVVVVVVNARASVMCLNESKEVEEEKVNTHHEHIFFVLFFFPQKSEQLGRKEEGFPVFCRRHSYSRTQITDTEERDDGDENGVEQRQTGQSSLDFEQQQQQQQQQH